MRVDFSKVLTDLDGKELEEGKKKVTLKQVCVNALMAVDQKENIDGTEKLKRYQLATKINKGTMDVSVEEVAKIKELVGKYFSTIIVGQVYELLEK